MPRNSRSRGKINGKATCLFRSSPHFCAIEAKMFGNHQPHKRKLDRIEKQFWDVFERQFKVNDQAKRALDTELARLRSEMAFALAEYRKAVRVGRDAAFEAARHYRTKFGAFPDSDKNGRKRPRRRPPGSAPAPVKPRPNPTPLVDGAEAPIE
jgi:hypothetical protein